ncbi:MAG: carbohydrate-binding protein [Prevotellaceae bacterium]|nr:carbohydrate-binding protein [Prevotellaceae bacterium]
MSVRTFTVYVLTDGENTIPARDFDYGGEGLGFHDVDGNQSDNNYRGENGDPEGNNADLEGNIGWTSPGEWQVYTIEVQDAGYYEVDVYLSAAGDGGTFSVSVDGNKSENTTVPNNGSWNDWRWTFERYPEFKSTQPKFYLSAGKHKVRFNVEASGYNFMALKFTYVGE